MAYTKNPRKVTKHQFASSTTVDGSRLDDCMEDVESRFNALQHGDVGTQWVQTVFHAGWQPKGRTFPFDSESPASMFDFKHRYPWMAVKNAFQTQEGQVTLASDDSATSTPEDVQNLYRLKGYENSHGGSVVSDSYDQLLQTPYSSVSANRRAWRRAWSTSFFFTEPSIITQISLIMRADGSDSILGTNRPYQYVYNSAVNYGSVLLDVADPNSTENKELDSQEYIRSEYPFDATPFNYHATEVFTAGSWTDMLPSVHAASGTMPYGRPDGIASIDEVNIPVPAGSRVRVSVVIPKSLPFDASDGSEETHMAFWNPMSLTMHVLERVE